MNNPLVIPMSVSESATQFEMSLGSAVNVSGDVEIEALSVTENGTYQEQGKAYSPVTVNVPQGGDVDGLIDGSIVALENDHTTSK